MSLLFHGGLTFDGDGGLHEGLGVLVEGDTISNVAPASDFAGFAGEVVNTTGGTLFAKILAPKMDTSFYLLGWTPGRISRAPCAAR